MKKKSHTGCNCHAFLYLNMTVKYLLWMMIMMRLISTIIPYREQLFENIWRDDIVDRKTWITIKQFFFVIFFYFRYFPNCVFVARVFFHLPLLNSLSLFFNKHTKTMVIIVVSLIVFSLLLLFGVNMKIQYTFNDVRLLFIFFSFGLEKRHHRTRTRVVNLSKKKTMKKSISSELVNRG